MHLGQPWRLGHRPALDGLRGVAILLVMVSHEFPDHAWGLGSLGVTMFFTLSGFLITSLLLDEQARTGRIALTGFWVRRVRRLAPALLTVVLTLLALSVLGVGDTSLTGTGVVLAYAGNWVVAFGAMSLGPLGHTWSLAIEEQFYLLWPLLVVLALQTRRPRAVLLTVALVGIGWAWVARWTLWDAGAGSERVYYGTDTRMDALLVGCGLAVLMTTRRGSVSPLWSRTVVTDLALTMLLTLGVVGLSVVPLTYLAVPAYVPFLTAGVLLGATIGPYAGVLSVGWLRWVGRRAYALYLWHVPVTIGADHGLRGLPHLVVATLVIAVSFGLAELSWRYVETPFRELGVRVRKTQVSPARA